MSTERFQDACMVVGLTFAITGMTDGVTLVSLQLPNLRAPAIRGVLTTYGFSVNLQDIVRLTGPERTKLRDLYTALERGA